MVWVPPPVSWEKLVVGQGAAGPNKYQDPSKTLMDPSLGPKPKKWKWVIDPREVKWIAYWDLVTTTALIFTSTVTPLEVAFLPPLAPDKRWTNGLFLTNRVILRES